MSKLFTPFKLKGLEVSNHIMMSPMCMYSAGWHWQSASKATLLACICRPWA